MKKSEAKMAVGGRQSGQRGFSMIELLVVTVIIGIVVATAIMEFLPNNQTAQADAAMREIVEQLRQAREYAITYRRYIQITFPTPIIGGIKEYQMVTTQRNDLTGGAGLADPVLNTLVIQRPMTYVIMPGPGDTPDALGNGGPIVFEGIVNGPVGGMMFDSTGALVDGASFLPMNGGTIFMGVAGQPLTTRAVSVLGATGRVRGWKSSGQAWLQF